MVELIRGLDPARVRARLDEIREEVGPDVEVLAATKYVALEELAVLADAGVTLVGENRAQDLEAKHAVHGPAFTWDFIGHLQSRKVRQVLPHVRLIHSVSSDSVLEQLRARAADRPDLEVLVEVNVAGDPGKAGFAPRELPEVLERAPVRVVGLMTMPPGTEDPEASRPHFAALRELAAAHGLRHLSMGTSQDFVVAVEEGATIVRLGSILYG